MTRKNLLDVDLEIARIQSEIDAGTADKYAKINLEYLTQRREQLIKAMTGDGPTKDINPDT